MQEKNVPLNNLTFPSSYFEDEVREGFYVTSMMKRYWACQLKVLSIIDEICERHDIKWFADYGTLLGAVRHEGYIPWDDDLDICMFRDDWEAFFETAKKEVPEGYKLVTINDSARYGEVVGRVVNTDVIDYSPQHLKEFFGCPYTVGIDIFPLDGVYKDEKLEKDRNNRAKRLLDKRAVTSDEEKHKALIEIEKVYKECPCSEADFVALMPFFIPYGNHRFPKELYENTIWLPFENTYVRANARYDELLRLEYGADYMQPHKRGGLHEYPVYASQERILKNIIGRNPFRYTIDFNELLISVQRYVNKIVNISSEDKKTSEQNKKIAVFLPCKAKWWRTMEPIWRMYCSREDFEVHVLPVSYYDRDYNGNIGEMHDERTLFPEYVSVEDFEKFEFDTLHPDVIVTQVPYDGWSSTTSVHEFFYSSNLLKRTDELIYVPCFDVDPPCEKDDKASSAISYLIEQEGVINADRIVVGDEKMRELYLEHLLKLCGSDTTPYWEQKIVVMDEVLSGSETNDLSNIKARLSKSYEKYQEEYKEKFQGERMEDYPEEWQKLLGENISKKVLVYNYSISFLLQGKDRAIDKLRKSLEIFNRNTDKVTVIFLPQRQILEDLERIDKNLWEQYLIFTKEILNGKAFIYDDKGISPSYIDKWDGYFGDPSALARKCVLLGIPVMLQNIEI